MKRFNKPLLRKLMATGAGLFEKESMKGSQLAESLQVVPTSMRAVEIADWHSLKRTFPKIWILFRPNELVR